MWVALFMTCLTPVAADCTFGAKTDRMFLDQPTCEAFVDHALGQLRGRGAPVSRGFCVQMDGEAA